MTAFLAIALPLVLAAAGWLAWPLLWPRPADPQSPPPRSRIAGISVLLLIPSAAMGIYFLTSDWQWKAQEDAAASGDAAGFQQAVDMLEARLRAQPGDVEGWKLLGRSRMVMGDYPAALQASQRAYDLSRGEDIEALLGYAEALALTDETELDGRAGELFERGLAIDPTNGRALWYGGLAAYRRNAYAEARQRWIQLLKTEPPEQLREFLNMRLAELDQRLGPAASPETASPAAAGTSIQLQLSVAPQLAARVPPDATLFVIARRGSTGPPVAVVRRRAGDLPLQLSISDADAMLPGVPLAGGGPLQLIARISLSGQPTASSGDLFGEVGYDFSSTRAVPLTIDRAVP